MVTASSETRVLLAEERARMVLEPDATDETRIAYAKAGAEDVLELVRMVRERWKAEGGLFAAEIREVLRDRLLMADRSGGPSAQDVLMRGNVSILSVVVSITGNDDKGIPARAIVDVRLELER